MSEQDRWQVAGSAPEIYERELVPAIFGPWAHPVVDLARPCSGDRVLDVACGTGVVARAAAERVGPSGSVIGIDLNPGMLAVARTVATSSVTSTAPLTWQEADAESLPFQADSFDVVFCQLGLQFFPDRAAALREMNRVLRPEGRLALMVWRGIAESPGFAALADLLERHVGPSAAAIMRAPFKLSDSGELAGLARAAGFRATAVRAQGGTVRFGSIDLLVLSYVAGSPLASHVAQAGSEASQHLVRDARKALSRFAAHGQLIFPIAAHLLSARK